MKTLILGLGKSWYLFDPGSKMCAVKLEGSETPWFIGTFIETEGINMLEGLATFIDSKPIGIAGSKDM